MWDDSILWFNVQHSKLKTSTHTTLEPYTEQYGTRDYKYSIRIALKFMFSCSLGLSEKTAVMQESVV